MLESFYQIHDYLVAHAQTPIRRMLMNEIDWSQRLIAIKGARGVGKTDFLLARAKEIEEQRLRKNYGKLPVADKTNRRSQGAYCLYVNFNNFYFTDHSLVEFAGEFVKAGGRYLLLDQMFKYPEWSKELRRCYDLYKDLHIVFSASPVMRLKEGNHDLSDVVKMYNLRGYSFREYLYMQTGIMLPVLTLEQLLLNHETIARNLCKRIDPLPYFHAYLNRGYYPSYREKVDFDTAVLKMMNMMLEVDVLVIKQIDVACLPKLRKLLHILLQTAPCTLNISSIASAIGLSRATTMNYVKYLKDARLLNLLYEQNKSFPMKPSRVYMQNTNIAFRIVNRKLLPMEIYETYFYHALHAIYPVNATERNAMFIVDGKYYFDVCEEIPQKPSIRPCAVGNIAIGEGNYIPLWMMGMMY